MKDGSDSAELEAHVQAELRAAAELVTEVSESLMDSITRVATVVIETLEAGNKLLFCGNGGSAADAQHLAAEYVVRFKRERASLAALALTTDTSVLTATANDIGFDQVFARQVEALGAPGDLLILHSTSGVSSNLLEAARVARGRGLRTAALVAKGGGPLKDEVDLAIVIPTESTARAQELQLVISHIIADWVDMSWAGA